MHWDYILCLCTQVSVQLKSSEAQNFQDSLWSCTLGFPMRSRRGSCCSLCMHSGFKSAGNFLYCCCKHIRHSHTLCLVFSFPAFLILKLHIQPVPTFHKTPPTIKVEWLLHSEKITLSKCVIPIDNYLFATVPSKFASCGRLMEALAITPQVSLQPHLATLRRVAWIPIAGFLSMKEFHRISFL